MLTHLHKDKILSNIIIKVGNIKPSLQTDIYYALLESIVSQQLSVKVADVIFNRFLDLFPERYPNAKQLIKIEDDILRKAGLSYRKASYLKNVAQFSLENNLDLAHLLSFTDDELIDLFTQIKGVGKWTVQMLLLFPMNRPDVFPVDDLGIQNNIKKIYSLTEEKKELKGKIIQIAEQWKPYRSLACKYIWQSSKL